MIRNIAITGVTTLEQYETCCHIVGDVGGNMTQYDINDCLALGDNTLYDNGQPDEFLFFWEEEDIDTSKLTYYTYDEFIGKYDNEEVPLWHINLSVAQQELIDANRTINDLTTQIDKLTKMYESQLSAQDKAMNYMIHIQRYLETRLKEAQCESK